MISFVNKVNFYNEGILRSLPPIIDKDGWPWNEEVSPTVYSTRKEWPKISIITPSYNQGIFIEETIRSILLQNYPNLEYIIIDALSDDDTINIIEKYEDKISYWISEKDNGQADAINKGIKLSSGEIFNWINSDDLLTKNSLLIIAEEYINNPDLKVIAGSCISFRDKLPTKHKYNKQDLSFEGLITEKSNFQQPSQWLNIKKYEVKINSLYHYSFDWDLILNLNIKDHEIKYIANPLSYFRDQPQSKTNNFDLKFKEEKLSIVKAYYKNNTQNFWTIFRYHFFLNAYVKTSKSLNNNSSLLILLLKNPMLIFSRFYLGSLFKSFTR